MILLLEERELLEDDDVKEEDVVNQDDDRRIRTKTTNLKYSFLYKNFYYYDYRNLSYMLEHKSKDYRKMLSEINLQRMLDKTNGK